MKHGFLRRFPRVAIALLAAGLGSVLLCPAVAGPARRAAAPAAPRVLFETGFEPWEGYDPQKDLAGQNGWVAIGEGGNGILPGPLDGFRGNVAYVGFSPPTGTNDLLNLFRPVPLAPVGGALPVVTFTVSFQIFDSTTNAPYFDDFRWSAYDVREERLFTLDFDNENLVISYALDDGRGFRPTGFSFNANEPYDLTLTLNFGRNLWTADINGSVVVNAQPITTRGGVPDLNEIDAVWAIRRPGFPGDNFMIFDDYRLVAEAAANLPPTLEPVGLLTTGAFIVRVRGEPGVTYLVEGTSDLKAWQPIGQVTAPAPSGVVDIQDNVRAGPGGRYYRAVSRP